MSSFHSKKNFDTSDFSMGGNGKSWRWLKTTKKKNEIMKHHHKFSSLHIHNLVSIYAAPAHWGPDFFSEIVLWMSFVFAQLQMLHKHQHHNVVQLFSCSVVYCSRISLKLEAFPQEKRISEKWNDRMCRTEWNCCG